jgi:hypothetical protein
MCALRVGLSTWAKYRRYSSVSAKIRLYSRSTIRRMTGAPPSRAYMLVGSGATAS